MVFNDLKQLNGQMIQYYEVRGNKVTPKTAQVRYNGYINTIILMDYDRLGRYIHDTVIPLSTDTNKRAGESSMVIASCYGSGEKLIYLQKEDAYNIVIKKLREERRNIDKKMFALQKELYKKQNI